MRASVWGALGRTLRQQRLTMVVAAMGGLALGFVTGNAKKPEYEGVAVLAMDETQSTGEPVSRHPEINEAIRARRVENIALNAAAAETVIAQNPTRSATWRRQAHDAARRMRIAVSQQSRIIAIVSRAPDPELAAALANSLAWEAIVADSPGFARIASTRPSWSNATIVERLERLRVMGSESPVKAYSGGSPSQALRVLRIAHPDVKPVPSPWSEIASRAALTGLSLGLLAATLQATVLKLFSEPAIRRSGEAARLLGIRELGGLPDLIAAERQARMTPAGRADEPPLHPETAFLHRPASDGAEYVRGVRTSLRALEPRRLKLIVVTSVNRWEGKTTVAANLAVSLAELGRRTALIDADLRRPRLHQVFNLRNRRGLYDLLSREAPARADFRDYPVRVGSSAPLWLLPAGVAPHGAPGMMHDASKMRLLGSVAANFDHVVIDAPAVLSASDARPLARLADGVILVVRAGVTHPAEALEARQRLQDEGAHLLGVVLNCCDVRERWPQRHRSGVERHSIPRPTKAHSSAA